MHARSLTGAPSRKPLLREGSRLMESARRADRTLRQTKGEGRNTMLPREREGQPERLPDAWAGS